MFKIIFRLSINTRLLYQSLELATKETLPRNPMSQNNTAHRRKFLTPSGDLKECQISPVIARHAFITFLHFKCPCLCFSCLWQSPSISRWNVGLFGNTWSWGGRGVCVGGRGVIVNISPIQLVRYVTDANGSHPSPHLHYQLQSWLNSTTTPFLRRHGCDVWAFYMSLFVFFERAKYMCELYQGVMQKPKKCG